MILYNYSSYFKSGEINSRRLSPLPICGCVIHEVSVVLSTEEYLLHSIVSKIYGCFIHERSVVLSTEDSSCIEYQIKKMWVCHSGRQCCNIF